MTAKITPEAAFVERLPETMRHAARIAIAHGAKLKDGELVLARDGAEIRFGMTDHADRYIRKSMTESEAAK